MRKGAFLLALVFTVAAATTADAAKRRPAAAADPAMQAQRDSANLLNDMMHPWALSTPEMKARPSKRKKKKSS